VIWTFGDFWREWRLSSSSTDPIVGVSMRLDRSCDHGCFLHPQCIATIQPGRGPHAYGLHCIVCERRRGWLPKRAGTLIRELYEAARLSSAPVLFDHAIRP
jgi:hypothetical protein